MALRRKLSSVLANSPTPYTLPLPTDKEEIKILYDFLVPKKLYVFDTATSVAFDLCILYNFQRDIRVNIAHCKLAIVKGSRKALAWLVDYYKQASVDNQADVELASEYNLCYVIYTMVYKLSGPDYQMVTMSMIDTAFRSMCFRSLQLMTLLPLNTWTQADRRVRPLMKIPIDQKHNIEHMLNIFATMYTIDGGDDQQIIHHTLRVVAESLDLVEPKFIPMSDSELLYYSAIVVMNRLRDNPEDRSRTLIRYISKCKGQPRRILLLNNTLLPIVITDQYKPGAIGLIANMRAAKCDPVAVDKLAARLGV